jgi:hypothetical protein
VHNPTYKAIQSTASVDSSACPYGGIFKLAEMQRQSRIKMALRAAGSKVNLTGSIFNLAVTNAPSMEVEVFALQWL